MNFGGCAVIVPRAWRKPAGPRSWGRAKALQAALSDLNDEAVGQFYPEVLKQIAAADPGDTTRYLKDRTMRLASAEMGKKEEALPKSR
ncbi:MAG: hypothetical protein ACKJSK_22025 [Roseibacillus sp.]|jgi:hypothetical protein